MNALAQPPDPARQGYLARRWRGQTALRSLLWPEMLGWGTAINVLFSGAALVMLAAAAPTALVALVHFAPLPWNIFMVAAVWRHPSCGLRSRALAAAWLALMTVV
jgi:hypothetical protein